MRLAATVSLLLALVAADPAAAAKPKRLKAFDSCKDLVSYARDGALRTRGGVGVQGRAVAPLPDVIATPPLPVPVPRAMPQPTTEGGGIDGGTTVGGSVPTAAPAPMANAAPVQDTDFSGTNVQEVNVDEPDIVKTDGRRIFVVTDGTLRVIAVGGGVTGTLKLEGANHRLLLRGDRVLAISGKGGGTVDGGMPRPIAPTVAPVQSVTVITEINVAGAPKVMRTMEVDGQFVDARQNGAVARLVIDAPPEPIIPDDGETLASEVKEAGVNDFLGHTVLRSRLTGKTYTRKLAPCDAVAHPAQFSGLGVLAILTIDLDRGMYSLDRDGVMAGAQVVYGSAGSLYVASRRFVRALELGTDIPEGIRTEVHRFDISDPTRTVYAASGSVPGFILNNYALSEHEGNLRVASTETPPWLPESPETSAPHSSVTVLHQDGRKLAPIGSVSGIGKGERIFAVRFMGDRAFVVTFVQQFGDPLFAVDLSNPRAPKVRGELHIPGYSAYLHPIDDTTLLGVGRDGSSVQASLFDVSDMTSPKRVALHSFGWGSTAVETEPHAFLYWPPAKLAVMPLQNFSTGGGPAFLGAVGLKVAGGTLTEAGRTHHYSQERGTGVPIERSLVIGSKLYTVSWLGIQSGNLTDLGGTGFTAF